MKSHDLRILAKLIDKLNITATIDEGYIELSFKRDNLLHHHIISLESTNTFSQGVWVLYREFVEEIDPQ
jgi:hypothetical protein